MKPPVITWDSDLLVNGKIVYLPLAPKAIGKAPTGLVNVLLTLSYDDPTAPAELKLTRLEVSFPGSAVGPRKFEVNVTLKRGAKSNVFLDAGGKHDIEIPIPAPANVKIVLTFPGFEPATHEWPLAPHASPTPEGSYAFPFKAADLGADEYITPSYHDGGQQFAYDFTGRGWDPVSKQFRRNPTFPAKDEVVNGHLVDDDHGKNTDHVLWNLPVYAAADGFVLKVTDKWPDNPRPFQSMVYAGAAADAPVPVKVVAVAGNEKQSRVLSAVTDTNNRVRVLAHAAGADGASLTLEGMSAPSALPFGGDALSLVSLSATRAVTAGAAGGGMILLLWEISTDGATITNTDSLVIPNTQAVKIEGLGGNRIAMARQPVNGNLELSVWDVSGASLPAKADQAAAMGGPTTLFDLAALGGTRFVSAALTAAGKLKVTVWDFTVADGKVTPLVRGDSHDTGDQATEIAVSRTPVNDTQFSVAARTAGGELRVYFFDLNDAGIGLTARVTLDQQVSHVSLMRFKGGVATAVRTAAGKACVIGWVLLSANKVRRAFTVNDIVGDVTVVALTPVTAPGVSATAAVGLRTAAGLFRLVICPLAGPNQLHLLCGNELVYYAHLQRGTLSKKLTPGAAVKKGDLLARAGSSGQSDEPHLHMAAVKLDIESLTNGLEDLDPKVKQVIIDRFVAGQVADRRRGLPFHGVRAMANAGLKPGGVHENPFGPVQNQGFGVRDYVIYPGVQTLCDVLTAKVRAKEAQLEDERGLNDSGKPTPRFVQLARELQELRDQSKSAGCA